MVNAKKVYRMYNELGLQLRRKAPERRVKAKLRRRPAGGHLPERELGNKHCDSLATGHKLRVLTVVDIFSRFSPVLDARFSYRAGTSC